jgi:uncharacterized protein YehS (DUF1456 family)
MRKGINNKGQALVEFILIMPIFIFIVMALFDLGNIIYKKYNLEDTLDTAVDFYKAGDEKKLNAYIELEKVKITIDAKTEDMVEINITKKASVNTPGLKNILGKDFSLSVSRILYKVNDNEK